MKKFLAMTLALSMTLGLAACGSSGGGSDKSGAGSGGSDETITFKMSFVDPESSPYAQGGLKIAEEVAAATDGKIQIEVVAGGSLGGERDTIELAMGNNLDIATAANSVMTNFIPEMAILDQAYLWKNADEAHAAVDGKLGDLIKEAAEKQGLHVIGFLESGFRNTFSTKPIQTIDDFKGVTIRTMENQYHQAAFESFGAMPIAMSYNDVFTALQQGTIDAQENPLSVITSSRFNEVQDYLSMTEHVYSAAPLMVSKAAYDALPDDLKAIVDEAGVEACQWEREYLAEVEVQWLDELETAGTQINYPDKAPFVDAMSSVYNQFVGDGEDMVSPELLEQVREIISQVE